MTLRIAMWSGPRNISTAMMRAWENRGDCAVSDEPLYAAYLAATGLDHPAREEVIAAGERDAAKVAAALLGPVPGGRSSGSRWWRAPEQASKRPTEAARLAGRTPEAVLS